MAGARPVPLHSGVIATGPGRSGTRRVCPAHLAEDYAEQKSKTGRAVRPVFVIRMIWEPERFLQADDMGKTIGGSGAACYLTQETCDVVWSIGHNVCAMLSVGIGIYNHIGLDGGSR